MLISKYYLVLEAQVLSCIMHHEPCTPTLSTRSLLIFDVGGLVCFVTITLWIWKQWLAWNTCFWAWVLCDCPFQIFLLNHVCKHYLGKHPTWKVITSNKKKEKKIQQWTKSGSIQFYSSEGPSFMLYVV